MPKTKQDIFQGDAEQCKWKTADGFVLRVGDDCYIYDGETPGVAGVIGQHAEHGPCAFRRYRSTMEAVDNRQVYQSRISCINTLAARAQKSLNDAIERAKETFAGLWKHCDREPRGILAVKQEAGKYVEVLP